ncbi:MAG: M6 family metalloprotease domain-containing protein, partial [candidate division Zixibacteria bacterium]|nr:M6 family metalloprotease domain-containing protein [candidate division Zixibacteria bacterium]
MAMPPTQEVIQQLKESGQLEKMIAQRIDAEARGLNSSTGTFWGEEGKFAAPTDFSAAEVDTFRALLILVDFSDNVASGGYIYGQPLDFDNLIFSIDSTDSHYSAAEFYVENSFGTFVMQGDVVGWYRMPLSYAYYVDGQRGFGDYPQNAQGLARDAILAADSDVDYSDYDNDNNGSLDGVFVVHAGTGYESTGNVNEIHSHKWSLAGTLTLDGVSIYEYTMEPEEQGSSSNGLSTMGVFAHEYGHFLGLPDLYDTD